MDRELLVDTSVIVAVLVGAPERSALIEMTAGCTLAAPESLHWEVGNALSAMLKRKRITLGDAAAAIEAYDSIPIRFVDVDLAEAVGIAAQANLYAYDAYFIAAARDQNATLMTLDLALARAARRLGIQVKEVRS